MPHYRVFSLDHAGHFADVEEMFCVNDAEAIQRANQMADSHGVELWQRGRMVARIAKNVSGEAEKAAEAMPSEPLPESAAA